MTPRSLFYATGGVAFGRFTTPLHEFDPADLVELLGGSRTGWTLGSGIQYVLDSNWSARIEYRYTDWGSKAVIWENRASTSKLTDSRAITGLSYKFGGPARFGDTDVVAMNWTGFYAGGHVGGVASNLIYSDVQDLEDIEYADFTQVLVGGHAGYNYQLNNNIVLGIEGDLNAKLGHGFKFDDLLRPTSPWDASIRARLGYAATARSLLYVTGGFAFGHFSTPQTGAQEPNDPPEEHIGGNRSGWTWGGGIQYALDPNWSARIEYRRTDWGTKTLTNFTNTAGASETADAKLTDNRFSVGVSYKFGDFGKGPVVSRY